MKRLLLLVVAAAAVCCSKSTGGGSVKLKSDTDSIAYILGLNVGLNLQRMDSTMRVDALCEGIRDVFRGDTKLSMEEAETYYLRYLTYTLPEKARAYEEQFLSDIAKSNRSYARTASGVTYTVGDVGDQELLPSADRDTVVLRYVIRTSDGRTLYSSYERGDTLRCAVSALRKGVRESLKLIGKGGHIDAWLPAATAYGAEGDTELGIAPNTTLYYEMELLDVVKYANRRR